MPLTSKKTLDKQYCLISGVWSGLWILIPGLRCGAERLRSSLGYKSSAP